MSIFEVDPSYYSNVTSLLWMALRQDIGKSRVGTLELFLCVDMVANLEENDWSGNNKRGGEQSPVADEFCLERELAGIKVVDNSGSDRLNTLVKPDVVCRTATGVG